MAQTRPDQELVALEMFGSLPGQGLFLARNGQPKYLGDVRCWVNSGKHLLALSFSGFDPFQALRTTVRPRRSV